MEILFHTIKLAFQDKINYPDMEIQSGGPIFISGPSGSGKSSLLRLFNATVSPSAGYIFYKNQDISEMDTIALRRKIILGGQGVYLFQGSILENFKTFHKYHESVCPNIEEIKSYLHLCCAPFQPEELCDTLSGGEKQRVFLAITLSLLPEVLLLDEPTSALDATMATEVMGNILDFCLAKEITPIIVSHDMTLRDRFAKEIITIGGDRA